MPPCQIEPSCEIDSRSPSRSSRPSRASPPSRSRRYDSGIRLIGGRRPPRRRRRRPAQLLVPGRYPRGHGRDRAERHDDHPAPRPGLSGGDADPGSRWERSRTRADRGRTAGADAGPDPGGPAPSDGRAARPGGAGDRAVGARPRLGGTGWAVNQFQDNGRYTLGQTMPAVFLGLAILLVAGWWLGSGRAGANLQSLAVPLAVATSVPFLVRPLEATWSPALIALGAHPAGAGHGPAGGRSHRPDRRCG